MKNLKMVLTVALGVFLFSSCSTGYGCPYNTLNDTEVNPEKVESVTPAKDELITVAIAR